MSIRIYVLFALAALMVSSIAGEAAAAEEEIRPPLTILLDVAEEIDGEKSRQHLVVYWVRTMLEVAGLGGVTHRPTAYDDEPHEAARLKRPEDARAELVLRGRSETHLLDKAVFYGKTVAHSYRTHIEVELVDPALPEDERVLKRWELDEDWGDGGLEQDEVAQKSLERMGYRVAALLILHPRVKAAVPEENVETVDALIERIREEPGISDEVLRGDDEGGDDDEDEGGDEGGDGEGAGDEEHDGGEGE